MKNSILFIQASCHIKKPYTISILFSVYALCRQTKSLIPCSYATASGLAHGLLWSKSFRCRPQPRPQPNNFRPQARPQPQFQTQVRQPQPSTVNLNPAPQPVVNSAPSAAASNSVFNCPLSQPNFNWQGRGFIVTFYDKSDGCNKFTGQEADEFCKTRGGRAVSLDSNEKALAIMDLLRQRAQRYMWTGGRIDHNAGVVTWPSNAREGYVRGQRFWSHTGG